MHEIAIDRISRRRLRALPAACLALAVLAVPFASLADDGAGSGSFTGRFLAGYRSVDVGGSSTKFREDLNLEDGPRLFELSFDFTAPENVRSLDRLELDLSNLGGDPFESFRFAAKKHGRYELGYRRTVAETFYADVILPVALSDPRLSNAGDFHTFDYERVRDTGSFGFRFNRRAKLDVGWERFTRHGESTTTLDISRDEFELDRPIDESYDEISVGLELSWPKATLVLEERLREFDNAVELFLPGLSLGEDPEDATILDFFFLDQPYDSETQQHTARLSARPTDRLLIRAAASIQALDLDVEAAETSQGIAFNGNPFATDLAGGGEISRDAELLDLDVTYLLRDRIALVGGLRRHHFDQEGDFLFGDDLGRGAWDVESTSAEAGLELHVSSALTLGFGLRIEEREVESAAEGGGETFAEDEKTDHTGFYGNLAWRPSKELRVDLELEDSSYNDPFTTSSPTDRQRLRLRGRYRWANGCYLQGTFRAHRSENEASGWEADSDQVDLRGGYRREGLDLSAGYSVIDTEREIDQQVTTAPGFGGGVMFLYPVDYRSDADFFDGRIRWRPVEGWAVGGELRFYANDGSFGLDRDDLRLFVERELASGYLMRAAWRTVDYDEDASDFDDHDADITELSVGYRW